MDEWTQRRLSDAGTASPPAAPPIRVGVPPLPPWLVPRPRLTSRISRGVLRPLTVVVGPVGAGKSAVAVEWAHTGCAPGPVAWVTCDGTEEQPEVFWSRVRAALREAGVDLPLSDSPGSVPFAAEPADGIAARAPASEWPRQVAALTTALAGREEPVVLVLDDFQPESGSPVAQGVAGLLRHTSFVLRLIVLSRRDPPLHLHRHRLAGEFTELRTADLAFSDRETATLLAQHGIEMRQQLVTALRERADGWAAGLRLAAMSMEEHPHPEKFVTQFTGDDEAVVSYLVEEILDGQDPVTRRLLLRTSILDHLNVELAVDLAGEDAADRFPALVRQNSFFQSAGNGWYRCHRMFADVLRVRLRHEAPGTVPGLHGRAAAWLGEHGLVAEAVRHALLAGDWDHVCRLVVHHLAIGQVLGLTSTRLPGELGRLTPTDLLETGSQPYGPERALVAAAASLHRGEEPASAQALDLADRLIGELPGQEADRIARCRLCAAVVRMAKDRCRDPRATRAATVDGERLFAQVPRALLVEHPELRALQLSLRGRAELREGSLKAAEASLTAGLKAAGAAGAAGAAENSVLRRGCLAELALLETVRGRSRAANEFAGQAQRPPLPASMPEDPSLAALHLVRAWSCLNRREPGRARGEVARTYAALHSVPDPFVAGMASLVARLVTVVESGAPPPPRSVDALVDTADWLPEGLRRSVRQACAASVDAFRDRAVPLQRTGAPAEVTGCREGDDRPRPPVEALSPREHDVLQRLAQLMTTEEIAAELYLSANTVKTHLKSVYRKLAVTRRSAAVRRARELELL
ncbi:helix-turn-helix transcriptional regulator [Streptomyces sp. Act143]|uniref:LuxR C-terminal-related transcriptional regulator n=1 Tax=Streptomyces sp. Act143 TaxID=2200760 RepID=UPI000D680F49|nr:LuxR C-terminal-related transcriptional regulator [Streptomyces sp. Act143]PWI19943.1 helix-turn-helix transcriptional regulator [Streptomyces sp. Act143]